MNNSNPDHSHPVLIYDGDCGICRYWVRYWKKLTGDRVAYSPYQSVAPDYPEISEEEFKRSIQYIENENRYSGALGVFSLLHSIFPYNLLLWLYKNIPGFSRLFEIFYTFFSRHRGLLKHISHICWGRYLVPAEFDLISWIFLRCLGIIYFAAFLSYAIQVTGLNGENGILPVTGMLNNIYDQFGYMSWLLVPTVFWINSSDSSLLLVAYAGAFSGILIILNKYTRPALIVAYIFYLSLFYAAQIFMQYQWDILLLECGFLAIFLAQKTTLIPWMFRWLVFRFMFLSGVVKLASGDQSWQNFTALSYHFETQPLPTILAWYAHALPQSLLKAMTGYTLFTELLIAFLVFLPRKFRQLAAWLFIILQTGIILTGNYNFFNLLALSICLFLFDDQAIKCLFPYKPLDFKPVYPASLNIYIRGSVAVFILLISASQLYAYFSSTNSTFLKPLHVLNNSLHITSNYGPFAVMTKVRNEIIIEGSEDAKTWKAYKFYFKPDELKKTPVWIIPHQPRLDWQMWFAALDEANHQPWFSALLIRLLQGSPQVTGLLKENPFPEKPPVYIRAGYYQYQFYYGPESSNETQWWQRTYKGLYFPVARIKER